MTQTIVHEEIAKAVAARLGVRQRVYRAAFAAFTVVVRVIMLTAAWMNPDMSAYILVAGASAILGTAAILFWAYLMRKSALYEKAGRGLIGDQ